MGKTLWMSYRIKMSAKYADNFLKKQIWQVAHALPVSKSGIEMSTSDPITKARIRNQKRPSTS